MVEGVGVARAVAGEAWSTAAIIGCLRFRAGADNDVQFREEPAKIGQVKEQPIYRAWTHYVAVW
jgi:hypothetical protein